MTRRIAGFVAVLGIVVASHLAGCAEEQAPRTYVQSNAVAKSVFQGEWYFRTCVIDVNYEAGQFTFPGDCSADYLNSGAGYSTPRVRWLIDQNFLYAYRSYEMIEGANPSGRNPGFRGEPIAAFAVKSHFDIRRSYNPVTGEEINVIVENTNDRRWAEREYVRVDWSQNLIMTPMLNMASLYDLFDLYVREPVPWFIQEESSSVGYSFPAEWRPRFLRTSRAEDTRESVNRVTDYGGEDVLYYMDFVTQEIFTPGMAPNPFTGMNEPWCMSQVYIDAPLCTSALVTVRNAFLKVPTHRQYEALRYTDTRWDRFGYWRIERPAYDAGDDADAADPHHGRTDFQQYAAGRFNIWERSFNTDGSPIPLPDRRVRPVIFYTTTETPYHLLRTQIEVVAHWNRHLMKMVRVLRGQALPAGEIDDPLHQYDVYNGDGYDCRIGVDERDQGTSVPTSTPIDLVKDAPERIRTDADFVEDRYLALQGDECVLLARVNSCVRHPAGRDGPNDPGEPCEQRGDMRYSFMSYVDQPGTGFLGIAEMRSDPVTGEYITGDANIGGPALDGYRTRALREWDMETGILTEEEILLGEDVREYMANLGHIDRAAVPQRNWLQAGSDDRVLGFDLDDMRRSMDGAMARARMLRGDAGRRNLHSDRIRTLVGTDIERLLFDNEDAMAVAGLTAFDPAVHTARGRLDIASSFRTPLPQRIEQERHMEYKFGLGCMIRPSVWIDHSVSHFVRKTRLENCTVNPDDGTWICPEWLRFKLAFDLNRKLLFETQLHEFGHVIGLRHNFRGTSDPANYHPQYYAIHDAHPLPDEDVFDGINGEPLDGRLNTMELRELDRAQRQVRRDRELDGIDWWMTSSLMDYTGQWYERLTGLGSYDAAAVLFGYGDVVEVWDRRDAPTEPPRPDRTPVTYWKYYHGGERCLVDEDCPFSAGGSGSDWRGAELIPAQVAHGATQRCRVFDVPGVNPDQDPRLCSNFYADMADLGRTNPSYQAREYKFCSDERTEDLADCNRFDEGASYREIVQNLRDSWNRRYLINNFRRFRRTFSFYPYLSAYQTHFFTALKIYQEMYHKYATGGDYETDIEPFGFRDQYLASVDTLNWFIETLGVPDVGSYSYDSWRDAYLRKERFPYAPGYELSVPLGVGKHQYTIFQAGLDGINRLERIGSVYDKIWTVQLLTVRDWGMPYTRDEPFYVNFYDLFPREMTHLLTGVIADEPRFYSPRVVQAGSTPTEDTVILYPNFWQGPCSVAGEPCWDADDSFTGFRPLESASFLLQIYGMIYALAEIPTFFDPLFQEQTVVYVAGSAGGIRLPTAARECPLDSDENCEYAVFQSSRFRRKYVALKVSGSRGTDEGDNAGISFRLVRKAAAWQVELDRLEQCLIEAYVAQCLLRFPDDPDRIAQCQEDARRRPGRDCDDTDVTVCESAATRCDLGADEYSDRIDYLRSEVDGYESFLRYMLEVQNQYGINSWIRYTGSL